MPCLLAASASQRSRPRQNQRDPEGYQPTKARLKTGEEQKKKNCKRKRK
eukprot:CAMPEP_0170745374 /NCGR_PEP_ID=MMETSP0437-20130122/8260_1 /TAXON_ID=0 /ORGANISM="Sexangularia sp." /LENGTH=48 /DNA_ID= /DNA_START= /DNA_END= /DNA_ORIENTATION=